MIPDYAVGDYGLHDPVNKQITSRLLLCVQGPLTMISPCEFFSSLDSLSFFSIWNFPFHCLGCRFLKHNTQPAIKPIKKKIIRRALWYGHFL